MLLSATSRAWDGNAATCEPSCAWYTLFRMLPRIATPNVAAICCRALVRAEPAPVWVGGRAEGGAQRGGRGVADQGAGDPPADDRQQPDPGCLGIVTHDDLDVRGEDEQHAEEAEAGDHEGHGRPRKAAVPEVAEVDEG